MNKPRTTPNHEHGIPETDEAGLGIAGRFGALSSFTGKAVSNLLKTWHEVKGSARVAIGNKAVRPHLPKDDLAYLESKIQACLESPGGEVTARANTVELGKLYLHLNETGRLKFFTLLAEKYDVDHEEVKRTAAALAKLMDAGQRWVAERALREALTAPRVTLLRQFNSLPDGCKFLVDMRGEILPLVKQYAPLAAVEYDLKHVLSSWFDIGLLDLEEITWRSPAALLEKLIAYEAVHAIRSWDDLKNRLDADRRVFAFFHNKMPLEPLIFVQVAFTKGLAASIQEVLDETKPLQDVQEADTAIFYSISNAQQGLTGISFGNFLIKRVVDKLNREFGNLKTYATLSPIPGFRKWLDGQLADSNDDVLFQSQEVWDIRALAGMEKAGQGLQKLLASAWQDDAKTSKVLKPVLMRLCARYLAREKRGNKALDPVAHFHLSNGARLEQLNWMGDTSPKGIKQSAGLMVNYHYKLVDIDDNHEDYVSEGKVAMSKSFQQWLK